MQSKASVVPLRQGDAVVFPVHHRPVRGSRGYYQVNMRRGVSEVLSGRRHTRPNFSRCEVTLLAMNDLFETIGDIGEQARQEVIGPGVMILADVP
jgi:hypothetical protein